MKTMALSPTLFQQAFQHHEKGELDVAEILYQRILKKTPRSAETLFLLGSLKSQRQDYESAISFLEQAIALDQSQSKYYNNYGAVLKEVKRLDEARVAYERALALQADYPQALYNMGNLENELGALERAQTYFEKTIALKPDWAEAQGLLGTIMQNRGFSEAGLLHLDQALSLGVATPMSRQTLVGNRGICLQALGRYEEARACYEEVLAEAPDRVEAHMNLAILLLLMGEMEHGWEEYEWRLATAEQSRRPVTQPQWDGSALAGRTLLIFAEQGFGDSFQFIRYLSLIEKEDGRVIFECQPNTKCILKDCAGFDEIIERPETNMPAGEIAHDVQLPLASLPRLFPRPADAPPGEIPYIKPSAQAIDLWRKRLADICAAAPTYAPEMLRVGLAWAGNPKHKNDHNRSLSLQELAPLGKISGVTLFSLQRGPAETEAKDPPARMTLIDLSNMLNTFDDTAAVLSELDLLITVDTSIAHLAGALGRPVWLMLPYAPDFRWLLDRSDSPWYPTMRIFRQPKRRDWETVAEEVAVALSHKAEERTSEAPRILEAEALFSSGNAAGAKDILQDLMRGGVKRPRLYNNLGVIYWSEGHSVEALTAFTQALELDAQDKTARQNCAEILRRLGYCQDADALLGLGA